MLSKNLKNVINIWKYILCNLNFIVFQAMMDFMVAVPGSCQEYRDNGILLSDRYKIQPSTDVAPFEVECDFVGKIGKTIITKEHSKRSGFTSTPNSLDGCASDGCFVDQISYKASMEQIKVSRKL